MWGLRKQPGDGVLITAELYAMIELIDHATLRHAWWHSVKAELLIEGDV
jgi:hypothetical protein